MTYAHREIPFDTLPPRHLVSHWSDERYAQAKARQDRWLAAWLKVVDETIAERGEPVGMEETYRQRDINREKFGKLDLDQAPPIHRP